MELQRKIELNGKRYLVSVYPGLYPSIRIMPIEKEFRNGFVSTGQRLYDGYKCDTEEDVAWHINKFKHLVASNKLDVCRVIELYDEG